MGDGDQPGTGRRALSIGRGPVHVTVTGYVLPGPPTVRAGGDEPQLAPVDGERAHVDDDLVRGRLGLGELVIQPQAPGSLRIGDEAAHSPAAQPSTAAAGG